MEALDTFGFSRTHLVDRSTGVLVNAQLLNRLEQRYRLQSASVPSASSPTRRRPPLVPKQPKQLKKPRRAAMNPAARRLKSRPSYPTNDPV